jgi:hypothetical protein
LSTQAPDWRTESLDCIRTSLHGLQKAWSTDNPLTRTAAAAAAVVDSACLPYTLDPLRVYQDRLSLSHSQRSLHC